MSRVSRLPSIARSPFVVLFVATAVAMLGVGMVSSILALYARGLGASGTALGLLFGVFAVSRTLATPIVGALSDRLDKRTVILAGLLLLAVLAALYIRTTSVWGLIIVRLLHGLSSAMVVPVAVARVAELAPAGREGETMGTFSVAIVLGMAMGPMVGGALAEQGGYATAFGALLVLGLLAFLIVALGLRRRSPGDIAVITPMRAVLNDPAVRAVSLLRFLSASAVATLIAYLPLRGLDLGVGPARIGILLTASLLVAAAAQRTAGRLADRMDAALVTGAGVVALGLAIGLIPLARSFAALVPLTLIAGLARAAAVAGGGGLAAQLSRSRGAGSVMGVVNMGLSVGLGAGPFVAGLAMGAWGLEAALAVVGAATAAAAAPIALSLRRGERRAVPAG